MSMELKPEQSEATEVEIADLWKVRCFYVFKLSYLKKIKK